MAAANPALRRSVRFKPIKRMRTELKKTKIWFRVSAVRIEVPKIEKQLHQYGKKVKFKITVLRNSKTRTITWNEKNIILEPIVQN